MPDYDGLPSPTLSSPDVAPPLGHTQWETTEQELVSASLDRAGWRRVDGGGVEREEGNRHHPATQLDSLHIVQGKLATHLVKIKSYSLTPYFLPQNKF